MKNSIAEYLNKYYKFGEVSEKEKKDLEEIFSEETFKKDTIIFKENEPGDKMYFVIDGMAKIYLTELDNGKTIAIVKPGEIFGEIAFFDKQPHSAETMAMTDTVIFVLDLNRFNEIRNTNPKLALKITDIVMKTFARRLRSTTRKMYGLY
jgi:CRP/FNR family transcriptional regulator, cyclic AMP receptor protein